MSRRRNANNEVTGVACIAQDVTEARQLDDAVAGMAFELSQLIESSNAPIFGIDTCGTINEWNLSMQSITGFSKEEAFDEDLVDTFIAPTARDKVRKLLNDALEGKKTQKHELEFLSKSGEPRFLIGNATKRRDTEGDVAGGKFIRNPFLFFLSIFLSFSFNFFWKWQCFRSDFFFNFFVISPASCKM